MNSFKTLVTDPYPLEGKVAGLLAGNPRPAGWKPTGKSSELYVELSEPIVRMASEWQDDTGLILDPMEPEETTFPPFTVSRFVGALGFLIGAGRCHDLIEVCARSVDVVTRDLSRAHEIPVRGADFYPKEVMRGILALWDHVEPDRRAEWVRRMGAYDPEQNYTVVSSKVKPEHLHNIVTFSVVGEYWKKVEGYADNSGFIDHYLETQLGRFTEFGMYRDPNEPMTYDFTARMNLSLLLFLGYGDRHHAFLDEMLRRGGLTTLLYLSPLGQTPFGGRSNQFVFNEATIAVICEYEAKRYKAIGDLELAGAFKRAARLAALSTRRWLEMTPARFVKNSFPPDSQHGRESNYGLYGIYLLLVASQLGFAHLMADDEIEERPAPFEVGGTMLSIPNGFHKVFATCGGYHLEVDTDANPHYDATGLGRIHHTAFPPELGLSGSIPSDPSYLVSAEPALRGVAIGPGWQTKDGTVSWLSDRGGDAEAVRVEADRETIDEVAFKIVYGGDSPGENRITERYVISPEGVIITDLVEGPIRQLLVQIPLLETNGMDRCEIEVLANAFVVRSGTDQYKVECLYPTKVETSLEPFPAPNRNGIYRVGCFKVAGPEIRYRLTLTRP